MNKEKKKIVLIVDNAERRELYKIRLADYTNVSIQCFGSAGEFRDSVSEKNHYWGFIIDLRTLIRTLPEDKTFIYELRESFPVMHISHSLDRKSIKGNIGNHNLHDKKLLDYFFNELCRGFNPRGIRIHKRRNLFLNVYLSLSLSSPGDSFLKANTSDISEGGCFIITPQAEAPERGHEIYMIPKEFEDQQPIACKVKWVLPWGEAIRHLPGFGVAFTEINPSQKQEIQALIRKSAPKSLVR